MMSQEQEEEPETHEDSCNCKCDDLSYVHPAIWLSSGDPGFARDPIGPHVRWDR